LRSTGSPTSKLSNSTPKVADKVAHREEILKCDNRLSLLLELQIPVVCEISMGESVEEESEAVEQEHELAANADIETKEEAEDEEPEEEIEEESEEHESEKIEEREDVIEDTKERSEEEHKKAKRRKGGVWKH
jgi:hypothetical protein